MPGKASDTRTSMRGSKACTTGGGGGASAAEDDGAVGQMRALACAPRSWQNCMIGTDGAPVAGALADRLCAK